LLLQLLEPSEPSSKSTGTGGVVLSITLTLTLSPYFTYKDPCDYIGSNQTTQDSLNNK
jgi:hypothetical protein